MKDALNRIFDRTEAVVTAFDRDFSSINAATGRNSPLLVLAITPPILAAFAITEIGAWCIDEIGRQIRIHEKRPAAPSLRGTPTPKDIAGPWSATPRTLRSRLRLGSRLADLEPTLDRTISRTTLPNGKTVFRARPGGMKGWLADRRVSVPYSTVMRYKKLAQRLRHILSLDDRLPLEWLIDGLPTEQSLPSDLRTQHQTATRRIAAILHNNPTLAALTRYTEKKLGILRLVTVRKARLHRRTGQSKPRKTKDFSVISRERSVTITSDRLEATKSAISRLLRARNLAGPALHLQNRLLHWLSTLPAQPPTS